MRCGIALVVVIAVFFLSGGLFAQEPIFEWVRGTAGDDGEATSCGVSLDNLGNLYIVGYFSGSVDFDPSSETWVLDANNNDIFLQKLDSDGNLEWVRTITGSGSNRGQSVATDNAGNVYITGYFENQADFDPGVGTSFISANGEHDLFVQKLDSDGNMTWTKRVSSSSIVEGYSITTDFEGNIITTGWFSGVADFDPNSGIQDLVTSGFLDVFIQKLDSSGNLIWAKKIGGNIYDKANCVTTDNTGNIYITGYFQGTADFDPGEGVHELSSNEISDIGMGDVYILKLDVTGTLDWVKQIGGGEWDEGHSITTASSGNVYVSGFLNGTVDIDPGEAIVNLTSFGEDDSFVLKLDSLGNFLWVTQMWGTITKPGNSISCDLDENVYLTGYFESVAGFHPQIPSVYYSFGERDAFIQKLNNLGDLEWVGQLGGAGSVEGSSITVNNVGDIFVAGNYTGTVDFDPSEEGEALLEIGSGEVFILKLTAENYDLSHTNPCPNYINGSILIQTEELLPPFNFSWSLNGGDPISGESEIGNFLIESLGSGTYVITISNAETEEETHVIELYESVGFDITQVNLTNPTNQFPNGSMNLLMEGGIPPFQLSWDGPFSGSVQIEALEYEILNIPEGSYEISISDQIGNMINTTVTLLNEDVPQETCNKPIDIVILNDVSGSVDATEYNQSREFFVDLIEEFNIGEGEQESRVAIMEWSSTGEVDLKRAMTGELSNLQSYQSEQRSFGGGTDPFHALTEGYNYIQTVEREDAIKVLALSTDGSESQVSPALIALADQYKAQGYIITTIAFDNAYSNTTTRQRLQDVASIDLLAPGAPAYADLDEDLAYLVANLYICPTDPGSTGTVYFSRDAAIEIDGYAPNGNCTSFDGITLDFTLTAQQQLALPSGTPVSFYLNNPALNGSSHILTFNIPCAISAGSSESYSIDLPLSEAGIVYALVNDDGTAAPPLEFPLSDIAEQIFSNNTDFIGACNGGAAILTADKVATTPIPICGNTIIYEVAICNVGELDAIDVAVENQLPTGETLLSLSIDNNSCAQGETTFDIPSGCCVSLIYEYDATNVADGNYTDLDVLLSGPTDQEYLSFNAANSTTDDIVIGNGIDCPASTVIFTKTVEVTETCEDSFVSYLFTIDNQTNIPLQGVQFYDELPANTNWVFEPYFLDNISIGETNFAGSSIADFMIAEIPANSTASFYIDAMIGDWSQNGTLTNTATLMGLPEFVNDGAGDLSASSSSIFVYALPEIETINEINVVIDQVVNLSITLNDELIIEWATGGDGSFSNISEAITTYTPGPLDIEQGFVELSVAAISPFESCGQTLETILITISDEPIVCIGEIEMPSETQFICGNESFTASPSQWTMNLETDIINYVLHQGNTNEIIEPAHYFSSNTISQIDGFDFNTEYYLSAIIGQDANGDGFVDNTDPCVLVSSGTPTVFLEALSTNHDQVCDETTGITTLTVAVHGGLPSYSPNENYSLSGGFNGELNAVNNEFSVELTENTEFDLLVSDGQCEESSFSFGPYNCTKTAIELIEFSGRPFGNYNRLNWQSASEIENDYYSLERSSDGQDFDLVTTIPSQGNSTRAQSYSHKDTDLNENKYYYRLSWTDISGKRVCSNTIVYLENKSESTISIRPNPASDFIFIESENSAQLESYSIYDLSGKEIQTGNIDQTSGGVDVTELPEGVYFLNVFFEGRVESFRVQKVE